MPMQEVFAVADLPPGAKKTVKVGETEILLVHAEDGYIHALEAKCPHAGGPLEQGAVCNGKLICPWHAGTFELATGEWLEPPPLRSLQVYAARVEGDAILVDPEPRSAPSQANRNDHAPAPRIGAEKHVVTIGAGAAAAAAVCLLRQGGFAGRLTVLDPVEGEPVDRTNLSKMALAGKKPVEELWGGLGSAALRVDRLQAEVVLLDGERGSLQTGDGRTIEFDAALLAPGGVPRTLGIAGEDLPLVHTLRHAGDVDAITATLGGEGKGKRVTLIGDSFIAFEAASALTERGLEATLVCRSPQPFSKKFGAAPAQAIVTLHQANGVALKLGEEAREIAASGVTLKSGETIPADLVIVAVGVEPATKHMEHGLPLEKDGGVPVGDSLQAAAKLWVGGDVASVHGTRIEHWRVAEQHGRAAASGMLRAMGGPDAPLGETLHQVPFFWTFHFGKRFSYVGHAEDWDDLQVDGSPGDAKFLAYYVKGNAVKAVFGCGRDTAMAMLAEQMRKTLTLEEARAAAEV